MRVRAGLTALATVVLVAAAGCTSGGEDAARPSAAATATTMHHATAPAALAADASPREVRARFEQLLGQHALLAVRLGRSEVAMAPELQKVVEASLAANAGALAQSVGVTYDAADAARFAQLWKGYTDQLAAYAEGAATGNDAAVQAARSALLDHCDAWGSRPARPPRTPRRGSSS